MGLLEKLFGRPQTGAIRRYAQQMRLLEDSIAKLRVGIFTHLVKKYTPTYGEPESKFLAVALMNFALLEAPRNQEATRYEARNRALIEREARSLSLDTDVSEVFSYLYAAQILHLSAVTVNPFPDHSSALATRATDLGLYVPNTYDICGSGQARDCIPVIADYAQRLVQAIR